MSLYRRAASCDGNQAAIVKSLRAVGAVVYHMRTPVDLLVGFNRQWVAMEIKDAKGRTTPAQDEFFRECKNVGGVASVVRNVDEALALIGCETRGVEIGPRFGANQTSPWLDGT